MFDIEYGAPLKGARQEATKRFLFNNDLIMQNDADFTVNLLDYDGSIAATGSLSKNVLKYIAVRDDEQGTGASATIVSELVSYAFRQGTTHLFLFTKPRNKRMFASMGFYTLAETSDSVMMENEKNGLSSYLDALERPPIHAETGAVVMNCNPFTLGHRYLIEAASRRVKYLHAFILSADKSEFSPEVRFELVRRGTLDINNLYVHKSSEYLISHATFPTYFLKDKADPTRSMADLDITLFATRIAKALNITSRFCGTEPYCPITRAYNERLAVLLPEYGIRFCELERYEGISASKVRALLHQKDGLDKIRGMVPESTFFYLKTNCTYE